MIQLIDEERDVPREVADIIFEQLQQKVGTNQNLSRLETGSSLISILVSNCIPDGR
jgi:hypothetical protein